MAQVLILAGGVFLTLVTLIFAFSGPDQGRAQSRRLDAIKERHQSGVSMAMESQLRKIGANRNKSNRLDGLAQRFIPNPALFRDRLARTGKDWKLTPYVGISAGIALAIAIAAMVVGAPPLLGLLGGIIVGVGVPHLVVGMLINRRVAKFTTTFPDAIELMVRGLRSGLPISETIGVVASEMDGPIGEEFRNVGDKVRIGRSMEIALQETADRLGTPEVQFFCITLSIQRETGGNLAETLSNLSEVLRKRAQMKLKIKAMSSESKASAYIIGCLPFVVFGMIYSINPSYMGGFFVEPRLMMLGAGGMVWMGIGAFIMSKMISFEI